MIEGHSPQPSDALPALKHGANTLLFLLAPSGSNASIGVFVRYRLGVFRVSGDMARFGSCRRH